MNSASQLDVFTLREIADDHGLQQVMELVEGAIDLALEDHLLSLEHLLRAHGATDEELARELAHAHRVGLVDKRTLLKEVRRRLVD